MPSINNIKIGVWFHENINGCNLEQLVRSNFTWFLKPSQSKESQKALTLQELLQLTVTA